MWFCWSAAACCQRALRPGGARSLKKACSDAAYLNTIELLLEEKRSELCELRDYDADR